MNEKLKKRLTTFSKSAHAEILYEYLEFVKQQVSDIRRPMKVKPEIEKEVRLGVCEVIDDLLIKSIQHLNQELDPPEDNWR